jgi:hypothetical protein
VPGVDAPQPLTRWEKAALLALLALFLCWSWPTASAAREVPAMLIWEYLRFVADKLEERQADDEECAKILAVLQKMVADELAKLTEGA